MDIDLSFLSFLELYRTDVSERRVVTRRVVEPFDEEAFHCRVVPDLARAAHAAGDALRLEQVLEVFACVLTSLVGVMQQRHRLAPSPHSHHQCIGHELRGHAGLHRPAHCTARVQVKHHRHVQPSLGRPDVGEVGDPLLVRRVSLE